MISGTYEYPDAYRATLQDFIGGRPAGEVSLELDNSTLYVGLKVNGDPNVSCGNEIPVTAHTLSLYFDSSRGRTSCSTGPRPDDRKLEIRFDPLAVSTIQYFGTGSGWLPVPSWLSWPVKQQATYLSTESTYVIELAIDLRPALTREASSILKEGAFGLAVVFDLPCKRGEYAFPNRGPSYRIDPFRPATWETVRLGYPPIVAERLLSYNAGQMPFGIGDGGSGDPEHFGYLAALVDHTCLSELWPHDKRDEVYWWAQLYGSLAGHEMWAKGLPRDLDTVEEEFPNEEGSPVVKVAETPPTWVIVGDPIIAGLTGLDDEDTGLLVLSRRPFLDGKVMEYNDGNCVAEDCFEDKGFIWARVLTTASEPKKVKGEVKPEDAFNGDEFLDLFCTHLQANPELWPPEIPDLEIPAAMRKAQLSELKAFIDEVRAPDRPALALGDFNVHGEKWPNAEYASMLAQLEIDQLSTFDQENSFLSDKYDFGANSGRTLPSDLEQAQKTYGAIGDGTTVDQSDCKKQLQKFYGRLDYIFGLPAPGLLPTYGVGARNHQGPWTKSLAFLPGSALNAADSASPVVPGYSECLSDHAALLGSFDIVRIVQPGTWNPASWHTVTYRVGDVEDLTDDCWGCGDADFWGELDYAFHPDSLGAIFHKQTGVFDDNKNPNLVLQGSLPSKPIYPPGKQSDFDRYFWTTFTLLEEDLTNTDHYDVTDLPQHEARFRFYPANAKWVYMNGSAPAKAVGTLSFTSSLVYTTAGTSGADRARATHQLKTVETVGPQITP